MDFRQIDQARKILGLGEEAGMEEIKEVFRNLSLKYHPDRCKDKEKKRCGEGTGQNLSLIAQYSLIFKLYVI